MSLLMISLAFAAMDDTTGNQPEVTNMNSSPDAGNVDAEPIMAQVQQRLQDGTHMIEGGQQLRIREHMGEMQLQAGNMVANTNMVMNQEMIGNMTRMRAQLSNGRNAEIKVMPDVAAERARERLQAKVCVEEEGCQIQLKEMMQNGEPRAAYEVKMQKESRFLGMFRANLPVTANIDAETGECLNTRKAWWAFLASESDEGTPTDDVVADEVVA